MPRIWPYLPKLLASNRIKKSLWFPFTFKGIFCEGKHGNFLVSAWHLQILSLFTFYMTQCIAQKDSKPQLAGLNPGIRCVFLRFIPETIKSTSFRENFGPSFQNISVIPCKTSESTGSGFKSQHKLCFPTFYKNSTKMHFFKHQNQHLVITKIDTWWKTDRLIRSMTS